MRVLVAALLLVLFTAGDWAGPSAQSIFGSYHLDLTTLTQAKP